MGEHIGENHFKVVEISVEQPGFIATFMRSVHHAIISCKAFFKKTNNDFSRFNYLGEWHSHPSYAVKPSLTDNRTMAELVMDSEVGANFAVLLIVRLDGDQLNMGAWTYFPNGMRIDTEID